MKMKWCGGCLNQKPSLPVVATFFGEVYRFCSVQCHLDFKKREFPTAVRPKKEVQP